MGHPKPEASSTQLLAMSGDTKSASFGIITIKPTATSGIGKPVSWNGGVGIQQQDISSSRTSPRECGGGLRLGLIKDMSLS
jgi:hypothetical protein